MADLFFVALTLVLFAGLALALAPLDRGPERGKE